MARRKIDDDYTEERRKEAHVFVDTLFDLRLACVIAGKQPQGGCMWRTLGDKRAVSALLRKLYDMSERGNL